MKRSIAFALLCIVVLSLCACEDYSTYKEDIVGIWKTTADTERYELFVFNADGTGSYTVVVGEKDDLCFDFTYTLEKNTLIRQTAGGEVRHTVHIEGGTLTLTAGIDKVVLAKVS